MSAFDDGHGASGLGGVCDSPDGVLTRLRAHSSGDGPAVPLDDVLGAWGAREVAPMDLYGDVFRLGDGLIQREGEPPGEFKANPVVVGHDGSRMHRKILFEDTFEATLAEFCGYDWAIVSGCTYFGRKNDAEHQSKLCALIVDLDGQDGHTLNNLLSGALSDDPAYPVPNYVVLSGHNVHLYYVLDEPLSLYPNVKTQAKALKYALIDRVWNHYTSNEENRQHQGINQGFRVPGGKTKVEGVRARAFLLDPHPRSVEELNGFVPEEARLNASRRWREPRMTLEQARKKYPEWYERVVVGGAPAGTYDCHEGLYEWWLRRVREGATYGHRYFAVMCLAIFAAKCGITDRARVERDALSLVPFLNGLNKEHPFTEEDAMSALECMDLRYKRYPRSDMERLSGISMPANKRRKKPLKRDDGTAFKAARAVQDIADPDGTWRNKDGAPQKRELVRAYAYKNPGASHSAIASALGISRTTVIKWLGPGWREEYESRGPRIVSARLAVVSNGGIPMRVVRDGNGRGFDSLVVGRAADGRGRGRAGNGEADGSAPKASS